MALEITHLKLGEDLGTFSIWQRLAKYTPILAYHSVSDHRWDALAISVAEFERQLRFLNSHGYRSISLGELLRRLRSGEPLEDKAVVLTFDDGYSDNCETVLPLLRRYGFVGTFFLVTGAIDSGELLEFDYQKVRAGLGDAAAFRPMNWEQVRHLVRHGMEIGSHTVSHCELGRELDQSRLQWEVLHSKLRIESEIQREVQVLCYPRGKLSPQAIAAVQKAGYQAAVWTPSLTSSWIPETRLTLKRVGVYRARGVWTYLKFRAKLTWGFFLLREAVSYARTRSSVPAGC